MKLKDFLLLGRKAMINLDSILKNQRHYFADKGPYSQIYGFSSSHVQMWELDHKESWAPKNWCFWTVVFLRVPWTARRSTQSILKEISPEYWLKGLMLKPKLKYFGHLMQRTDSLEKTLMLGKIEVGRRRGGQRMRWMASLTRWTWVEVSSRSWWWTGKPGMLQSMGSQSQTQLSKWNDTNSYYRLIFAKGANLVKRYLDDFPGHREVGLEGAWKSLWT